MTHKAIPKVPDTFLLGNLRQFRRDSLQTMIQWQQQYGDLVEFKLGLQRFYLLSHPSLLEQALIQQSDIFIKMYRPEKPKGFALILGQGLLTSQGALWRRQRQLIQPLLQKRNLANLLPQMQTAGETMLARWQQLSEPAEIDLAKEMMQLALEVITQTMFSTSVLTQVETITPALDTALRYAAKTIQNPFTLPLWIPSPDNQAFKHARAVLDTLIYTMIQQRRKHPVQTPDLLNLLLNAEINESSEKMSDQQIRDEVLTIFTAGHETTANVLTWTLYLLSQHPAALEKIQQELHEVLGKHYADAHVLPKLVYTRAVLDEAMRLRPPAGILMRKVIKDTEISGYTLKAGSLAIMNLYNIHHHPQLWQQPEAFKPERFLTSEKHKFSHLPFGLGSRMCIGNQFALFESQLLLSMILQNYQLQPVNQEQITMKMDVTIRPKQKIIMRLQAR